MKPQNFFIVRRPLLSTDFFFSFQKAVGNDPQAFESYLRLIYLDPLLQNALHLASPGFYQQVQRLLNNKLENGKEDLLKTLYKYLIRMSTRCTPFGLFAGYSLGAVTEKTSIHFDTDNNLNWHAKLDPEVSRLLVKQILDSPEVKRKIKFFPNNSLYQIMNSFRYIERDDDGKTLSLSAIKSNRYLAGILEYAQDGRTVAELGEILRQYNVGKKAAKTFVDFLIESQFLVSSFELNASGENYLERIQKELKTLTGCEGLSEKMTQIRQIAESSQKPSIIQQSLKSLLESEGLKTPEKSFLQTDLTFRTSICEISRGMVDIFTSEIQQLSFLNSETENPDLKEFASRLFSNFGSKAVPLLPALDPASGIGYGTLQPAVNSSLTLLSGLAEPAAKETRRHVDTPLSRLQKRILEKTRITGSAVYELTAEDITAFENEKPLFLPESFYVFGSIISDTESDFDKGEFMFDLKALAGPSALNLMSRFAQSDPDLKTQLENAARLEDAQNPGVIFAEICHVPSADVLRVINRSSVRQYEIPYLSHSSLPRANQILPSEILVSSPDGKRIILTCDRLHKRIVPRLTSAHYYANRLPFYRFLCELAQQSDSAVMGWDWGELSAELLHPRIMYKHLILQKASWQLDWNEFEMIMTKSDDQLNAWEAYAVRRKLPRYFQIRQGDNELLVDGGSLFSLQLLEDTLKKSSPLILTEYLETHGQGFLREKSNSLANEVVLPFLNPRQRPGSQSPLKVQDTPAVFHLGSEWLYVKLYCSEQAADFLLSEVIAPFCDGLHSKGELVKWFFIRYYDPKPHLRVRIEMNENDVLWSVLLDAFQKRIKPYLENGLISAFTTDRYVREVDRYKLLPYGKMESIFFVDSYLTCASLGSLIEHKDADLRWLLALRGCETILKGAGLDEKEKFALIQRLHSDFSQEFNAATADIVMLDQKYRNHKRRIISFLDPKKDAANEIMAFTENFNSLCRHIHLTFCETVNPRNEIIETAGHLMHLFLNRWFNLVHRKQEWVIYHFLKKYYDMVLNLEKTVEN